MLVNIDIRKFAEAIRKNYRHQTEASSFAYANEFCNDIDQHFEPLVQAWIEGEKLPVIREGPYTVGKIMQIQNTTDFLFALKLLNTYRENPGQGEEEIWKPRGAYHPVTRK